MGTQLGSLYVNDAPLACLTTSNSVAEIKCSRKVMGLKMTEEVRKLSQFFLKKFPLDVKERHIKTPEFRDYYDVPFSAVLGGTCNSVSDLMDKILLANSLLDNANAIYLVGEVGIAAANALDVDVSRIERFSSHEVMKKEYDSVKPFFIRLFQKAAERGVNVQIPSDFVTVPAMDLTKAGSVPQTSEQLEEPKKKETKELAEEKSGGSRLKG